MNDTFGKRLLDALTTLSVWDCITPEEKAVIRKRILDVAVKADHHYPSKLYTDTSMYQGDSE